MGIFLVSYLKLTNYIQYCTGEHFKHARTMGIYWMQEDEKIMSCYLCNLQHNSDIAENQNWSDDDVFIEHLFVMQPLCFCESDFNEVSYNCTQGQPREGFVISLLNSS